MAEGVQFGGLPVYHFQPSSLSERPGLVHGPLPGAAVVSDTSIHPESAGDREDQSPERPGGSPRGHCVCQLSG